MIFVGFLYTKNLYGVYNEIGTYEEHTPETIKDCLCDIVESNDHTETVWCTGLDLYHFDVIRMLHDMGYRDVTLMQKPIKKFAVMDYDYTVATTGVCYRIRIRTHGKKTLTIFNADNLIGKDIRAITRDFSLKNTGNECADFTYAVGNAIKLLIGKQKKRLPYTISMVAQKRWKEICNIDYTCAELIDCYSTNTPDGRNLDAYLRDAYRGGWCYMSDRAYRNIGDGKVYDVNSLYPWVMKYCPLPWGDPVFFDGEIPEEAKDDRHYYYIRMKCTFDLKKGYFPYLGINDWLHRWGEPCSTSDYIDAAGKRHKTYVDFDGKRHKVTVEITLAKSDYEIFIEAYDVKNIKYMGGVYFRTSRFIFKDYVDYYYEQKQTARSSGRKAQEWESKRLLNALSGTLAKIRDRQSIVYDWKTGQENVILTHSQSKSYIHIAAAILSYARARIYRLAIANHDNFIYTDTDSLHIAGNVEINGIKISTKLGDFKIEHTFDSAKYYKRKMYILHENNRYNITFAGLSKEYRGYIEDIMSAPNGIEAIRSLEKSGNIDLEPTGEDAISEIIEEENYTHTSYTKQKYSFQNFRKSLSDSGDKYKTLLNARIPNGYRDCVNFESFLVPQFMEI